MPILKSLASPRKKKKSCLAFSFNREGEDMAKQDYDLCIHLITKSGDSKLFV